MTNSSTHVPPSARGNPDKELILNAITTTNMLAVKDSDVAYVPAAPLQIPLILRVDSYKFSHAFAYPNGIHGATAYIEARTAGADWIIPFGLQITLQRYLTEQITEEHVKQASKFAAAHGDPFDFDAWMHIVRHYNGYVPVTIRAVPEGTPVRSGNAIVTITCVDDPRVFWVVFFFETLIQRAVWYPTTVATKDYEIRHSIEEYYALTGADPALIPFALHDFGARGVTCAEQAEIGGAAHLVNFQGSDNVEGTLCANHYYNSPMSSFSVPATEHSVECSWGNSTEQATAYLRHAIHNLAKPGGVVSIVIDGYDVYREAEILCTVLKDEIISSGVKVVFRPDSGDMMEVVPRILALQAAAFGYGLTSTGHKKINHVGVIQGDGVTAANIRMLLGKMMVLGYSADNVVFGSGGALLQKMDRDTFKFAQKGSAVLETTDRGDQWRGIAKNPITDTGKRSKEGVLVLARSSVTRQTQTIRVDQGVSPEWVDLMQLVYQNGRLYNHSTLDQVRARCRTQTETLKELA